MALNEIEALMLDVGRKMAHHMPSIGEETFADRPTAARRVVDDLDAATELISDSDRTMALSHSCPLAAAVRKEVCVCRAVAAFFEAPNGQKTVERCISNDKLTCRFEIETKGT